ncbi:MAG: hypothetical protein K6G65_07275 [Lachnospiraceae bacterium]|nr:hypothetical protein [Lachnospiraceae bacterium]
MKKVMVILGCICCIFVGCGQHGEKSGIVEEKRIEKEKNDFGEKEDSKEEILERVKINAIEYVKEHGSSSITNLENPEITEVEYGNEPIVFEPVDGAIVKEKKGDAAYYVVFHDADEEILGTIDLLYDKTGKILYGIGMRD